jgi:hypothetical protein
VWLKFSHHPSMTYVSRTEHASFLFWVRFLPKTVT